MLYNRINIISLTIAFVFFNAIGVNAQSKLIWPLSEKLHSKTYISNYVDSNKSANAFQDFNCGGSHGYDGHLGTDIAVNSFRDSDQGVSVYAAASGKVTIVRDNQFDRNFWPPYTGSGNGIWIEQDNGDFAIYWHMRKHSIPVKVGDRVDAGQFIGYVASSGSTPIPHLHFQINNSNSLTDNKDPFSGGCNNFESLWETQPEYVSNLPLKILDFGITTNHDYKGVYQNGILTELKEKLLEPKILGMNETAIGVWAQFQGNLRDHVKISLTGINGSLFNEVDYVLQTKRRYGWYVFDFPFAVESPVKGQWTLTVSNDDGVLATKTFMVGDQTIFAPRFYPISGKSFQINTTDQQYSLIELGNSGEISYQLIGAPPGFVINGNTLTIPAVSNQLYRNLNFSIAVSDIQGYKDYFKVHVVDPIKAISTFSINKSQTGFWYNPISSGRGFAIEVNEETGLIFLAWFTFDSDTTNNKIGASSQRWLTAIGTYGNNSIEMDINNVSNGTFDSSDQVTTSGPNEYGSINIDFEDCNHAILKYDIHSLNLVGSIPIQRLFDSDCE